MKIETILLVLLIFGAIISAYLTYVHYAPGALFCPDTGIINCEAVVTSSYSVILGIPLAIYALIWFVVAVLFTQYRKLRGIAGIWMVIGIGGFAYSVFSMYMLGMICVYCSMLDAMILASVALFFMQKP